MAPQTQVNSATLIMGVTGSGKSSLAATLARYVWARWRKVTLYYNTDGGGFPAEVQAVQNLGILRVFRMLTRDQGDLGLAFETCYRACQGWWPQRIDPRSGEVPPGVAMIPPIMTRYEMYCPQGHLVKSVVAQTLLTPANCPTCRVMVQTANMQVRKVTTPNKGFEDVGAVFFDGLSSMLAWGLRDLGHRAGRMELKGEEAAIGGKVVSGDLRFGGTTRSHVGFAQSRGEELVHLTLGIPNLVVPPIFTALTHEDVDERSLSIIGPKIAGRAKTDEAPQWFGNVLETAKIPALDGSAKEQRVLYLSEFIDGRNVRHLLKHRGSPGTMPALLADPVDGDTIASAQAFSQVNLGVFFQLLDEALAKRIAAVREEVPDAPGLPEGIVEIGESTATQVPQAAVAHPLPAAVVQANAAAAVPAPAAPQAGPVVPTVKAGRGRKAPTPVAPAAAPAQPPAAAPVAASVEQPPAPVAPSPVAPQVAPAAPSQPPAAATPAPTAPVQRMGPPAGVRPAGLAPPPGARPPQAATSAPRPPAAAPRPPQAPPKPPGT